jgi:hypothetical protein
MVVIRFVVPALALLSAAALLVCANSKNTTRSEIEATDPGAITSSAAVTGPISLTASSAALLRSDRTLFQHPLYSLQMPAQWAGAEATGHDWSYAPLLDGPFPSDRFDLTALEPRAAVLLSQSPATAEPVAYRSRTVTRVEVGERRALLLDGVIPGRLLLDAYLGSWAEVTTPSRPRVNVYVGRPGEREMRVVVPIEGRRFEFAMPIREPADERLFYDIVSSIVFRDPRLPERR